MNFVEMEADDEIYFAHLQCREDVSAAFVGMRFTVLQRIMDLESFLECWATRFNFQVLTP